MGKSHSTAPSRQNLISVWFRHHLTPYKLFWSVAGCTLLLDQITKLAVRFWVPNSYYNPPIEVIPGFFNLVHVYNKGAAFSILRGYGFFLVLLALVALWAIFHWRRQLELEKKFSQLTFGLLIGGIVGNVVDRMINGEVLDFLDCYIGTAHWPSFNVADMGICIGVGIYILKSFKTTKGQATPPSGKASGESPEPSEKR